MDSAVCPVDVICLCAADGTLRPLRLQLEDGQHNLRRVDIQEIVSVKPVQYVGIEAQIFLCRAFREGREQLFELRYLIRSHAWQLIRWIC